MNEILGIQRLGKELPIPTIMRIWTSRPVNFKEPHMLKAVAQGICLGPAWTSLERVELSQLWGKKKYMDIRGMSALNTKL